MTVTAYLLRDHIDYTIWATNRLLDVCADLPVQERQHDFKTADKSIEGTLTHLLTAERTWFRRIQGDLENRPAANGGWDELISEWPAVHREWQDWAAALSPDRVDSPLEYSDLKNNRWVHPVWQIVLHVVNHSTHHRGQVSGFLRALGRTPPSLDYMAFVRQRQSRSLA